ncbi:BZ3500_MvSof-1268-A1-R1_Chr9g10343 [Microbotryum saponariae]|uniref:BZ3500_MvSof-1268-A1-R1_Chr9g10343 protein n=1 Tax=Microbotryum saponariae TaxID=289078 RepID=A0A2X0N3Z2_9BASI|nr:BZ3501_MvSof-1269-A2-R1_Chr9g10093 [Microbotryum saponariae]SCZ99936.1 BZ3500_MvSof-1268-A1-R1_Chr9g10343 [Microbotryum saponariae]
MLFKLPIVLAMALLTLGASASERFTVTSLRRRGQPGDYLQDRGIVKKPLDGEQINVGQTFQLQFNGIWVGKLLSTVAIEVAIEIPSLNYTRRLAKNLASPGFDKPIIQNFFFMHPKGSSVKKGTILPGTINVYELQSGTRRNGGGNYFLNKKVPVKFVF